jgi:hypothetical protein
MSVQIGPAWVGRVIARLVRAMIEMGRDVESSLGCIVRPCECPYCGRVHGASGCPPKSCPPLTGGPPTVREIESHWNEEDYEIWIGAQVARQKQIADALWWTTVALSGYEG